MIRIIRCDRLVHGATGGGSAVRRSPDLTGEPGEMRHVSEPWTVLAALIGYVGDRPVYGRNPTWRPTVPHEEVEVDVGSPRFRVDAWVPLSEREHEPPPPSAPQLRLV